MTVTSSASQPAAQHPLGGAGSPAEHRYRPAGSAATLFASRSPEVLLSGAAGTGKSRACLEKLHAVMLLNPGARALIVRKTAASLGSTGLVTFREIVAREALASGEVKWYGGSKQQAAAYVYGNKSEIVVGGLDKASRIMSSEYDMIYVQEATELTEDDWESLTTRLRNGKVSFQQLMADCNPGPPHHWLKRRCDSGSCQMIYCQHEDNLSLYFDGGWTAKGRTYIDLLDRLTGVRLQRLRHGLWAAAEGLVYDGFDPAVHLSTMLSRTSHPPDSWPRYLAVDFGYTNPFVCQWWAEDPDGRLYLYREIYLTRTLVEDHAAAILKAHTTQHGPEPRPRAVICDHDAEDRATLERKLGWRTVKAHKSVSDGIQAVQERLKPAGDGKPRLYLCRDALLARDPALADAHRPACTADEVLEYIWDATGPRSATGGAAAGLSPKEAPLKQNDHGMDAMRYLVAHKDLRAKARLTWL